MDRRFEDQCVAAQPPSAVAWPNERVLRVLDLAIANPVERLGHPTQIRAAKAASRSSTKAGPCGQRWAGLTTWWRDVVNPEALSLSDAA